MPEIKYTNRLIHESSPYLLQHAYNPVDWYPWGDEAFQKAKAEDKPILLSCGYSACHWCHVMERESFEDPEIAALMNKYFINIKVDREERPDIDQIYQEAVQMIAGHGGWPLTVFLDHDRRPFFGGTYYPPISMYGRPGFTDILEAVHRKWVEERERIREAGAELAKFLRSESGLTHRADMPGKGFPEHAASELYRYADTTNGGFDAAPKFPNPTLLRLFLIIGSRKEDSPELSHVLFSLNRMARGGIYDQLGGGFHRYSTDPYWLVPHFEKMLYDNAQLLGLYSIGYQLTGAAEYHQVVRETSAYVRREMTAPEGGFYATQDADSEGEEGKYFLWSMDEIREALDQDEARLIIDYYGVTKEGNFEGRNILNRLHDFEGGFDGSVSARLKRAREKLLKIREARVKPFRDEKVITAWNGLMISGLAVAYQTFQDDADYQAARRGADFLLKTSRLGDGGLARIYKDGKAYGEAFLDDYAFLAQGLLDLYQADFNADWLARSIELTETAISRFSDGSGLYYLTPENEGDLVSRPLSGPDQAIPSGVAVQAENLLKLAAYTGRNEFWEEAGRIFSAYSGEMQRNSWGYAGLIAAFDGFQQGIKEFTFVGDGEEIPELLVRLRRKFQPHRILAWTGGGSDLNGHPAKALFEGRKPVNGKPTCYVCLNQGCLPPLTEWEELERIGSVKEVESAFSK
ncbi:MAG: thioredoxin domain-containing protein [Firmicutes bacterium]|nr:thioredoxin domain-containing protein [Bacillota bacterium]